MSSAAHHFLFELTPSVSLRNPHKGFVSSLVELNDGSFLSCPDDYTTKRWLRSHNSDTNLQLLGAYQGNGYYTKCAMEKDDNTFLTGSTDNTIKVWNTDNCKCLKSFRLGSSVYCMTITKDKTRFLCDPTRNSGSEEYLRARR